MADEILTEAETQPVVESTWTDGLPEDVASHPAMSNVKDVTDLANQFINAQGLIGRSIQIPSDDASEEQWAKFNERMTQVPSVYRTPTTEDEWGEMWGKLGRPEAPDGYGIDKPEFSQAFHKANLTKEQAQALNEWMAEQDSTYQAESDAAHEARVGELKEEWGRAYDSRVDLAQKAVRFLDEQVGGLVDYLNDSGAGNDPQMIKLFYALSKGLEESKMEGTKSATMTTQEAMDRAQELTEQLFSLDEIDPRRQSLIDQRAKLFEMAVGSA